MDDSRRARHRGEPGAGFDHRSVARFGDGAPRHRREPADVEERQTIDNLPARAPERRIETRRDDHDIQPRRSRHAKHHEEQQIDQHFDRDRPDRPVETQVLREPPIARHQQLGEKIPDIVVLIDEETSVQIEIDRLQQRDEKQRHQMQRIKPREAQREELPATDSARRDRVAVFPEENESADAPEHPDAERARIVKRAQQAVERQTLHHQSDRLVGHVEEVAIMEHENGKGGEKTQHFQPEELVGFLAGDRFRNRRRYRVLHVLDTHFSTAASHTA